MKKRESDSKLAIVYGESVLCYIEELERRMAELHPDTTAVPIWRRPAKRSEEPIRAYRCWTVVHNVTDDHGWILCSIATSTLWEGPVLRADARPIDPAIWDRAKREHKPDVDQIVGYVFSIAGIHALKTLQQAQEASSIYLTACYGEVSLWGRVAEFKLGYRAEYCIIKKLYLWYGFTQRATAAEVATDLTKRYGCDVELVKVD